MSRREQREIALYELGPAPGDAGLPGFALIRPAALTIGVPDTGAPHRHDFHEIILVETGAALHTIDGQVSIGSKPAKPPVSARAGFISCSR